MTDAELLQKVKTAQGITGTYQDETIKGYISDVKEYLVDAGVKEEIVESDASAGAITRGVIDLWTYGPGSASLSNYFRERAIQLSYKEVPIVV
ncbi:MAG: phage gp6-like head-tail connector protein [Lachnospiraceae bacterium]|nr:phage gp6-like head-tail connector protein [Lachnospiraceae bacterium]